MSADEKVTMTRVECRSIVKRAYPEAAEIMDELQPSEWVAALRGAKLPSAVEMVKPLADAFAAADARAAETAAAEAAVPKVPDGYPAQNGRTPLRSLDEWEALPMGERVKRMDECDWLLANDGKWPESAAPAAAQSQATPPESPDVPEGVVAAAQRHAATTVQPPPGKAPLTLADVDGLSQAEMIERMDEIDALLAGGTQR
jgi:hypothetical protein